MALRTEPTPDKPPEVAHQPSRLGLVLFAVYLVAYVGFILISALACDWFELILPGGLNLAVVYGFGLILLALLLAAIYGKFR